jgi:hypothetical protein
VISFFETLRNFANIELLYMVCYIHSYGPPTDSHEDVRVPLR